MVRPALVFATLVARLLPLTAAQDNTWIFPSNNDGDLAHVEGTYAEGSLITLSWETSYQTADLVLWQNGNSTLQYLPNSAPVGGSTFQWTVDLSGQGGNPYFDLKDGHTFFFEIFNEGTSDGFESQYINITSNAAASTTTSSATQSPTSKSTSPPTSSTTQTSPAANTNTPTAKSTGLSKGAQAGIGVGVGVVGLALIIGAIFFFLARRRRAADTGYSSAPMELPPNEVAKSYYGPPVELAPGVPKYAGQQPRPMSELPETPNMSAVSGLHEL